MDVINAAKKISEAGTKLDKLCKQIAEQVKKNKTATKKYISEAGAKLDKLCKQIAEQVNKHCDLYIYIYI